MSKILSRRDLDFLLYEWLEVEGLCERERFSDHSRETFDAFLDVSSRIATVDFSSHNALADQREPTFDGERVHVIGEIRAALRKFNRAGLVSASMDARHGGLQLPEVVHKACLLWFQAANIATSAYPMLSAANANLLIAHGNDRQVERYARPIAAGRYFGTMCLSEPHAGSSLADVTTRATAVGDGTYRLFGTKMWISGGDHEMSENIVHLVLARHEGASPGVKGLSLFVVPKLIVGEDGSLGPRNDVALAGLNHKMGYRGTVSTVLGFGEGRHHPGGEPGAVGELVGEEGQGLTYMFHMMNESRIAVGAGAAALGYTSYLHALDYARSRTQGRAVDRRDPAAPPVPIVEHADVRRMLLASKSYVEGGAALVLYAARLLDELRTGDSPEVRSRAHLLLDVLTPIVKSWPSQWSLVANSHAIQIHGGYGYSREYPVEQFYRDNRLNPIHEGTHGIQALDLLGRKVRMQEGAGLELLLASMRTTADEAGEESADLASRLTDACDQVLEVTTVTWSDGDRATALANATDYLEVLGHVVVAWMWLEQVNACAGKSGAFYDGKRAAASYFFEHELPRMGPTLDVLRRRDPLVRDLDPAWL